VAWDLWELRNGLLHDHQTSPDQGEGLGLTNKMLCHLYQASYNKVSREDLQLFKLPLSTICNKDIKHKKQWITQVRAAVKAARVKGWMSHREQHERQQQ
jgi:hypothetical protein